MSSAMIRTRWGDYSANTKAAENTLKYKKKCLKETEKLLKLNKSIVIDNTNYNSEKRSDDAPAYFKEAPSFTWDRDRRDEQLEGLNQKIVKISSNLQVKSAQWAEERRDEVTSKNAKKNYSAIINKIRGKYQWKEV